MTSRILSAAVGVTIMAASAPVFAQAAAQATQEEVKTAMKRLEFLVGNWEGDAWMMIGPGGRHNANQKEWVKYAAGGELLVVEGLGIATGSGAMLGKPVHQAFAVVSYDAAAKKYRFRAYRVGGAEILVEPEISERKLVWKMPVGAPGQESTVVFTMQVNEQGEWIETGDVYPPGATQAIRIMEMRLAKKP